MKVIISWMDCSSFSHPVNNEIKIRNILLNFDILKSNHHPTNKKQTFFWLLCMEERFTQPLKSSYAYRGVKSVSTIFVSTFWLLMNKYDSIWNTNALQLSKAFIDEAYGIALSVGVERFELPISCSQSR